jgi:hypothetical protein
VAIKGFIFNTLFRKNIKTAYRKFYALFVVKNFGLKNRTSAGTRNIAPRQLKKRITASSNPICA